MIELLITHHAELFSAEDVANHDKRMHDFEFKYEASLSPLPETLVLTPLRSSRTTHAYLNSSKTNIEQTILSYSPPPEPPYTVLDRCFVRLFMIRKEKTNEITPRIVAVDHARIYVFFQGRTPTSFLKLDSHRARRTRRLYLPFLAARATRIAHLIHS